MATEIICPKCGTEMTEGFVLDRGHYNAKMTSFWVEGKPEESFRTGLKFSNRDAFRRFVAGHAIIWNFIQLKKLIFSDL